ncbi:hypothetical protein [Promicromonospora sp. NPDC060271]|uniref:hypothetical protein n=1 Tax=Promicromonospora sp. NPDC060271 TaxID=3347089 RepID=UPI0036699E07
MTMPGDPFALPLDPPAGHVADEAVQVEAAESELRRLGLEEIRVRHHGDLARLEAPHRDLASMTAEPLRGEVLRAVRSAGFRSVALDLEAAPEAAREAAADPGDG